MEKPVAIYLRVSTTGEKNGREQDTAMQRRDIVAHLADKPYMIYEDKGYSGTKRDRPALTKLLEDCRAGKVSQVVCWKLDRFFRSLQDLINTLAELNRLGIAFVAVKDGIDLSTATGRLMMQVIGAFAEFEAAVIKERVIAGLETAKSKGTKLGRPYAKGYNVVKKLRSDGMSAREISRHLEMPIRTVYNALRDAK